MRFRRTLCDFRNSPKAFVANIFDIVGRRCNPKRLANVGRVAAGVDDKTCRFGSDRRDGFGSECILSLSKERIRRVRTEDQPQGAHCNKSREVVVRVFEKLNQARHSPASINVHRKAMRQLEYVDWHNDPIDPKVYCFVKEFGDPGHCSTWLQCLLPPCSVMGSNPWI